MTRKFQLIFSVDEECPIGYSGKVPDCYDIDRFRDSQAWDFKVTDPSTDINFLTESVKKNSYLNKQLLFVFCWPLISFLSLKHECAKAYINDCHRLHAVCINQIGGYLCQCENGFYGSGLDCSGKFIFFKAKTRHFLSPWWCSFNSPTLSSRRKMGTHICL